MRVGKADGEAWLRLSEATHLLGVSPNTLRRWSDAGKLACYRSPGGHRRYRRTDIEALLRAQSSARSTSDERRSAGRPADADAAEPLAAALPALDALTRAAAEGIGVTACLITVDGDGASRVVASYDRTGDHDVPAPGARLTRESAPAVDEVRNTGRRMVVADVATSNVLTPNEVDGCRSRGEKAVLALPLAVSGRLFGVMQLVEHRTPRRFSGANVAFAEFVARQAAGIIAQAVAGDAAPAGDQAPLLQGDRESASAEVATISAGACPDSTDGTTLRTMTDDLRVRLGDLGRDIARAPSSSFAGERDVLDGLRAFEQLAHSLSGGVRVTVFAFSDGLARELSPVDGGSAAAIPIADDPALAAVAAGVEPRLTTRDAGTVCLLPLYDGVSAVGVVELSGAPSETLLHAAEILGPAARLLAATLATGAAAGALERRVDDLEAVVQAGIEDISSLSTDEVLLSIIQRLSELTRSPVVDVYAVEGGTLRALIGYDAGRVDPEWEGVVIPIARYPCSRRAIETGEIVVAASLDDEILGENGRFSLERWGYQSQLSMPLIAGGRVIGLVELSDYTPRDFAEDLDLIHGLGRVAARALENARLFEQVERRSRILNELVEIGTFASSCHDFDTVFRHVAERLLRTLDAAACDVYRVSDGGLRCVASFDRSGFDEAAVGKLLDVATYPTVASAVSTGEVLVIAGPDDPQLNERERQVYREFGFKSEVCVPLMVNESPFGLIDIYDTRPRQYSEYLTFLRSLGMSLAGSFASTLLLQQLEHRTAVLREVVELGERDGLGGVLPELLTTVAERVRATTGVADCDAYALTGDELRCLVSVDERGPDEEATGRAFSVSRFGVPEAAANLAHVELEAITDSLTGLYNHRYLHERLDEEIERCRFEGGSLGLLLIDIDDFRAFNDRYGHSTGDRALRAVAHVIESSLRQVDLAARYGGEEFAVVLIDTDEAGVAQVAERIREGVAHTETTLGHQSLSVSIGTALCPADAGDKEELIDKADWAMFLAKRRGRDRVVSFGAVHGALAPEQAASVHGDHVAALADVATARDALTRRRRAAVTHLALAAARMLGLDAEAMRAVAAAAAAAACERRPKLADDGDVATRLAAVAATYVTLATRAPYRPMISESEAMDELRSCPAFTDDPAIAETFAKALAVPRS